MKNMKGKEEITGQPWKLQSITNSSTYECNNVEILPSPWTVLFEVKLAKARQMALYYRNGKKQHQTIQEDFPFAMILKEQNYCKQDMMEYYKTDHTKKTQEYLKINIDQPEMKANIVNGAKSAKRRSLIQSCTLVWKGQVLMWRVENIPFVTPLKAFGNAEKSEKFAAKLAWSNRTAMEYALKNRSNIIAAQKQDEEMELLLKEVNRKKHQEILSSKTREQQRFAWWTSKSQQHSKRTVIRIPVNWCHNIFRFKSKPS